MNSLINTSIKTWANFQEKDLRKITNKLKIHTSQVEIDKLYLDKVAEIVYNKKMGI
jgi:hypothetical protein